jgi:hypothetical protein
MKNTGISNNKQRHINIAVFISILIVLTFIYTIIEPAIIGYFLFDHTYVPLSSPASSGIDGQNKIDSYHRMMDALFSEPNVTMVVEDKLWVPWYSSSSECTVSQLHGGDNCNIGAIDMNNNCMVSDELSQVGMLIAMGNNQTRMNHYFNTIKAIPSEHGTLVAWRVARMGNEIIPCHASVNGNCDAASDADARIIISLYTAAANSDFDNSEKRTEYLLYANRMAADFYEHDIYKECKPSSLGYGDICYWLAAGPKAKSGGLESGDFTYTGYYPDAIIAMLQACSNTENDTYCKVAGNITLNYFQAAEYDGTQFRVPPGMAFKWTNTSGIPKAQCTRNCNPPSWDDADAPRAMMLCQANYYAKYINATLPMMDTYCEQWYNEHMSNSNSAVLQYYANGTPSGSPQTSYYAQGLQAILLSGTGDKDKFNEALQNAISHYTPSKDTWSWTSCFGIYRQYFPIRALGFGIGRDLQSFPNHIIIEEPRGIAITGSSPQKSHSAISPGNTQFSITVSNPESEEVHYAWKKNGTIVHEGTSTYNFEGEEGTHGRYNISVTATAGDERVQYDWDLRILMEEEGPISFHNINPSTSQNSPAQYTVNETITLSVNINNPSQSGINARWNANTSAFDERYGTSLSTTITPYSLAPGMYKVDATINSSTNSINHAFYISINPTQTQNVPVQVEIPSRPASGGGGGSPRPLGNIEQQEAASENATANENEQESDRSSILRSIIIDYYTGNKEITPKELLMSLRELLIMEEE